MNRTAVGSSALGSLLIISIFLRGLFPGLAVTPDAPRAAAEFATPGAGATPSEPSADLPADGPWKAAQSFFAGWKGSPCAEAPRSTSADGDWCIPPDVTARAVIAIAPDPVRTHLSLTFDRRLESLQVAAQDSGYIMDRYWLPWRVQPKTDRKDTSDSNDAKAGALEEARAAQPGLVLFRQNTPDANEPQVIFVFLVADTATTGIDGTQFRNAVKDLDAMCGAAQCGPDKTVRVIGPSSSGSLSSLAHLLDAFLDRPFTVYSGSVSSLCAMADQRLLPDLITRESDAKEKKLAHDWLLRCGKNPDTYTQLPNRTFKTFVHDTESAVDLFVNKFYPNQKAYPDQDTKVQPNKESALDLLVQTFNPPVDCRDHPPIAMLSEAATTFGSAVQNTGVAKEKSKDKGLGAEKPATDSSSRPSKPSCVATYVYPREIASLRNAGRAATGNTTTSGSTTATATPGQLPLDLTDRTNSNDAPPDFSIVQSPLSKEAVLMNLAAGMRRERYQYIGISGTNILDVLFLTSFLRTACPDSRLFVLNADLMFERELDNSPYIGMVALTTYPLIEGLHSLEGLDSQSNDSKSNDSQSNDTQAPQAQSPWHPPFADAYEEGEYHAALATFKELLGKSLPAPTDRLATHREKPLWMTVVGTGGYWPIRLLDNAGYQPRVTLARDDLSGAWVALLVLISAIAALQIGVLLTASPFASRFRDFALVSAAPRQRLFYIQVACATVALALSLLLLPAWWHAETMTMILAKVIGTLALIAIVCTAILLGVLYLYRWQWTQRLGAIGRDAPTTTRTTVKSLLIQLLPSVCVWALAGGFFYLWWRLLGPDPNDGDSLYAYFFAYRAVHMGSGVSPLTPLFPLLIAVYAWACFEIWRLRFNDDLRPRLTPDGFRQDASNRPRPGQLTERSIADSINRYLLKSRYRLQVMVVFAIWLAFLHPRNPFQIFERTSFSILYGVLFSLVVFLMLSSGFRMAQIWIEVRRLLVEIDRRPIRAAFSRFKSMGWSFWRQGGEDAEWAQMVRSLEAIAQLESGGRPRESGLPTITYFRERIESLLAKTEGVQTQLAKGATPSEVEDELTHVDRGIETVQQTLASGDGNLFLRAAIDDARTCVQSSVDFVNTFADLERRGKSVPDRALLKRHVGALPARLQTALDVLELEKASKQAQDSVECISRVWLSLQRHRPRLPALESLREYARPPQVVSCAKGVALENIARVSRFYKVETRFCKLQHSLAEVLGKAWKVVESRQAKETSTLADPEERHELEEKDPGKLSPEARQLNVLEEFIALRYLSFIRGVLVHLRHVMIFLALSFSLSLISLNIYSFEPHQSLIWSFTLIFMVTGGMVVGVLVQLHRDPILSRVTGTTANALDLHFYLRLVAFGGVPLLTLLATHYPSIGRYLVGFLQPSLEALK
jgi:hypothetical protein